jgi:hypothetical protein
MPYKYESGQSVEFLPTGLPAAEWGGGRYLVTAQLPERDGKHQYRIHNVDDAYERVVKEGELKLALRRTIKKPRTAGRPWRNKGRGSGLRPSFVRPSTGAWGDGSNGRTASECGHLGNGSLRGAQLSHFSAPPSAHRGAALRGSQKNNQQQTSNDREARVFLFNVVWFCFFCCFIFSLAQQRRYRSGLLSFH